MNNIVLVTGGAKSGKSEYAEQLAMETKDVCYIATGIKLANDPEMDLRIKRHQERRPDSWTTEERYEGLATFISKSAAELFLLDDVTMLVTNLFYNFVSPTNDFAQIDEKIERFSTDDINAINNRVIQEIKAIITAVKESNSKIVLVTNEVGLGVVPGTKQTRILRDLYGLVNQLLAKESSEVTFVISGIPNKIK
ncbi:bifunctional adenosylcobinamide kinase/adenosylcobinamide-phosphate guanylyltransferase [Lentilactobacillus kosonis]|uniref:Adenosylcobinamide kinase n=1 Tax=Lentilactobacillus kosonis TaxID=2810561 RepID=A0A401FMU6_9LACO|nr:bifunctional adenosylcobinamide kinase/adenosylcobinamide-phosphate guanylyltransferase [Lentilactobacillus kosonis]GAY73636.1 adenosylcobinamide-phosphate guanylyltransferase [Lentilactobacillus kosonis]